MIVSSRFPGIIPMYKKPQLSRACVVSELLPTEPCVVCKEDEDFLLVERFDGFTGWVLKSQLEHIELSSFTDPVYLAEFGYVTVKNKRYILPPYSPLWNYNEYNKTIYFNNIKGVVCGRVYQNANEFETIFMMVEKCMSTPFKYGGRTIFGFDAPGLIQFLFRSIGIPLSSDIHEQAQTGYILTRDERPMPGDVLFFCNTKLLAPSHVGLLLPNKMVAHVSAKNGFVICEEIDNYVMDNLVVIQTNRLVSPV